MTTERLLTVEQRVSESNGAAPGGGRPLAISVTIPTRNRATDLRRCLESLTAIDYPDWEILIVDQSDNDATRQLVDELRPRLPNLVYEHRTEKGLSRARNWTIEHARGAVVAFLDDDCIVGPHWLAGIAAAFERYPRAALVFASVVAPEYDWRAYHLLTCEIKREQEVTSLLAVNAAYGIGAGMYLRRAAAQTIGPFDTLLGPGSGLFESADDIDYLYRALLSGFSIVRCPTITVTHYGFRDYASGAARRWLRTTIHANGGAHAKLLRCGQPIGIVYVLDALLDSLRGVNPLGLVSAKPTGLGQIQAYLSGLLSGLRRPIDTRRRLYQRL